MVFHGHRASRNLIAAFLGATVLPALIVVILGLLLLRQDEIVRQRQLELHRSAAVNRAVAQLRRLLEAPEAGAGLVRIEIKGDSFRVDPTAGIAFWPTVPRLPEAESGPFKHAESLEFGPEPALAIAAYQSQASAMNGPLSVALRMRLARVLRKTGRNKESLAIYAALETDPSGFAGVPASLAALHARAELSQDASLRERLNGDLRNGRWRLDRGSYEYYSGRSLDTEKESLAAAAEWLWERRASLVDDGHRLAEDQTLIRWKRDKDSIAAFAVSREYQESHWFAELNRLAQGEGLRASIGGGPGMTIRAAAETGLPWSIGVSGENGESGRRVLLTTGFGLLVISLAAGIYFSGRALRREIEMGRQQSEFVAAVSHEFRTPLTSMRHFTELLLDESEPVREKRVRFYEAQFRATERLQRLVESLLDFARMEAGRRQYEKSAANLCDLAASAVRDFQAETGASVALSLPEDAVTVQADAEALSRAIWNLLDNARKYGGEPPWIGLTVGQANGDACIRVSDRGAGIPPSERARVFQKFVRGSRARDAQIKGTGLGLAMVKHIAEGHGGTVTLESEEGRGSTFSICLPRDT